MLQQALHDTDNDIKDNQINTTEMKMYSCDYSLLIKNMPYEITRQSLSRQLSNHPHIPANTISNRNRIQSEQVEFPVFDDIFLDNEDYIEEDIELNFYLTDQITPQTNMQTEIESVISEISKIELSNKNTNNINNTVFMFDNNNSQSSSKSPSFNTPKKSKKRKNKTRKKLRKNSKDGIGYDPNSINRAQGNIQISKSMTENIIPNSIKEYISNVYSFMDKSYCLSIQSIQYSQIINENIKIINYDFHDKKTNEILYCIIISQDISCNKSRGYKYKMMNKLFTKIEIQKQYCINKELLPNNYRNTKQFMNELMYGDKIKMVLMDKNNLIELINDCQWHKVNIFNRVNNKRRMTLSLTKPEFISQYCEYVIKNNYMNNDFDISLIPIMMFNSDLNEYWIEYVWIIQIDGYISIGISFKYTKQNGVRVNGIHLDKEYLINQHELVLPNHNCKCFEKFDSYISNLKIGNPDDLQNKINYYKQVIEELTEYKENVKLYFNSIGVIQTCNGKTYVDTQQQQITKANNTAVTCVQSPRYQHINYYNNNVNNNTLYATTPNSNHITSPTYAINTTQHIQCKNNQIFKSIQSQNV